MIQRLPHKIIIEICHAKDLLINSDKKARKQHKWKVIIIGGKKKCSTEFSSCQDGNPIWDCKLSLKLNKDFSEPIVFVVVDQISEPVGQVVIPLIDIKPGSLLSDSTKSFTDNIQSSELEVSQKCSYPTGYLFYRIWVQEYYVEESTPEHAPVTKRLSIFGWKQDSKSSYIVNNSQQNLNNLDKSKASKRLSFFKSNDKIGNSRFKRGKAKSLANIHAIEDIEQSQSSDSDMDKKTYFPPSNIYDNVTQDLGWVRVGDINNEKSVWKQSSFTNVDGDKVEVWSVQPDNGLITGNFTVVMEGSNFTSGLFELTYVCISGLDPIDATNCTEIVSDTELILTMPAVSKPGMVNIDLELLDGSRITCSKNFHYLDPNVDDQCPIFTPRYPDAVFPDISSLDDVLDQYDDGLSSPIREVKHERVNSTVMKRDSGMGSFNGENDRTKLSDYGSHGSIRSHRALVASRKVKNITLSKMELFEEVNTLRKEVADLQMKLQELDSSTTSQITAFKCQLETRDSEIDNISNSLCKLKMKLLEDGLTHYLELK